VYWEDAQDQALNSLEDVDLFYSYTHGGAWGADTADYAMWEDGGSVFDKRALSRNMKLGDDVGTRKLSIFAVGACDTHEWNTADDNGNKINDSWERWDSVFSGGLRAALGSQDSIAINEHNAGKVFAQYLNAGYTLKWAWYYAYSASGNDNDVSVIFSGQTGSGGGNTSCTQRGDTMTWDNFDSFPRVTGVGQVPFMCAWQWSDV
jgi:hypothetical protein